MVRLCWDGCWEEVSLVSISRWQPGWERIRDIQSGDVEIRDGFVMIKNPEGEREFLDRQGLMVKSHGLVKRAGRLDIKPKGSLWDKPVLIDDRYHRVSLMWKQGPADYPMLWIDGAQIFPEQEEATVTAEDAGL